jgi:hypothetical protein
MQFLIGFEFEFGWEIDPKKYYQYDTFSQIKKELKKTFGREWISNILHFTHDGSLSFPRNKGGHYGVELVTKPMKEEVAISFCKDMLNWMKNHPRVITNKTCSLHVNINFLDKKLNRKIDYYQVLCNTPQKDILRFFGREKNTYCTNSEDKKFSLIINNKETPRHKIDYWMKSLSKLTYKTTLKKPYPNLYKKNPYKAISHTIKFSDENEFFELIKKSYINRVSQSPKGLAIVEKEQKNNKYYEFRMIGNSDYEAQYRYIKKCITIFKKSLKSALT